MSENVKIKINEYDKTSPGGRGIDSTDIAFVPGFSSSSTAPVLEPILCTTVKEFEELFPYEETEASYLVRISKNSEYNIEKISELSKKLDELQKELPDAQFKKLNTFIELYEARLAQECEIYFKKGFQFAMRLILECCNEKI